MNIIGVYGALGHDGNYAHGVTDEFYDSPYDSWQHDAGAALVINGNLVCALLEERLTRQKYEGNFPYNAIEYCLKYANISHKDIDLVLIPSAPVYLFYKILKSTGYKNSIKKIFPNAELKIIDHHLCHISSSLFTSSFYTFNDIEILAIDGSGTLSTVPNCIENTNHPEILGNSSSSIGYFNKNNKSLKIFDTNFVPYGTNFGAFYSTASVNILRNKLLSLNNFAKKAEELLREEAPGKIMGLSAYGHTKRTEEYRKLLEQYVNDILTNNNFDNNINIHKTTDHSFYIDYHDFYRPPGLYFIENQNSTISYNDDEKSYIIQILFEQALLVYLTLLKRNNFLEENVCFSGGTFLNVLGNSLIKKSGLFENIHIPPYTSDTGLAIGAALYGSYKWDKLPLVPKNIALLGKEYSNLEILEVLKSRNIKYLEYKKFNDLCDVVSDLLEQNKIIAWFQDRSESGPRALGSRSILMNPTFKENKDILNKRVKHREYWRPFAGSILREHLSEYFEEDFDTPYMLYSFTTREDKRNMIPAINHIDNSCRIQTVTNELYPKFYELLQIFYKKTGIPVLLNTSFNDNGEPIVETPEHAIDSFLKMDIDALAIGNYLLTK